MKHIQFKYYNYFYVPFTCSGYTVHLKHQFLKRSEWDPSDYIIARIDVEFRRTNRGWKSREVCFTETSCPWLHFTGDYWRPIAPDPRRENYLIHYTNTSLYCGEEIYDLNTEPWKKPDFVKPDNVFVKIPKIVDLDTEEFDYEIGDFNDRAVKLHCTKVGNVWFCNDEITTDLNTDFIGIVLKL